MKTIETPLFRMISSLGKEANKEKVIELIKIALKSLKLFSS